MSCCEVFVSLALDLESRHLDSKCRISFVFPANQHNFLHRSNVFSFSTLRICNPSTCMYTFFFFFYALKEKRQTVLLRSTVFSFPCSEFASIVLLHIQLSSLFLCVFMKSDKISFSEQPFFPLRYSEFSVVVVG